MTAPSAPGLIDLNADLGEGFGRWSLGDDDALLDIITSANVACGFHAGDPTIMRRVCAGAAKRGVAVGAQFSYRDLAGFGRRPIVMPTEELANDIVYQIGALAACAQAEGTTVRFVKPHGALNNVSATDPDQAAAIVAAVRAVDPTLPVLVLPGTELAAQVAGAGLIAVAEAYPDRAYEDNGQLRSRRLPDAVLHDIEAITTRAVELALHGRVQTSSGGWLELPVASLCLHGDNPASVSAAGSVAAALRDSGLTLAPFVERR